MDFTNVTFVGTAGINRLVDARNRPRVTDDDVLVRSPAPLLSRLLALFGLTEMIDSAGTSHTTHAVTGVAKSSRGRTSTGYRVATE